jgi:hypothetical protein
MKRDTLNVYVTGLFAGHPWRILYHARSFQRLDEFVVMGYATAASVAILCFFATV